MQIAMFLLLLAVCYTTFVAKNAAGEASNDQRSKEAIRLWLISDHLKLMLVEPTIPESELRIGRQLLDQVCIGEPEFNVALVYNSTVDNGLEMLNRLHVQQLIKDHDYAVSKNNLEQSQNSAKELYYLKRQSMIIGNIGIIDTKVVAQDPRSISWYYAFCKVAFNDLAYARLTFEEQSDLKTYLTYLLRKEWLQTSGPYCRQLQKRYEEYKKYLPARYRGE